MALFKLSYCEECGEARIPHFESRFSHAIQNSLNSLGPVTRFLRACERRIDAVLVRIFSPNRMVSIANFFTRIGIGSFNDTPNVKDSTRTLALYEGAEEKGVRLRAFKVCGLPVCFIAEKTIDGKLERMMFEVIPRPKGFVSLSLDWMDDKGILKQKLMEAGLPCAEGGVAHSLEEALALFRSIGRPVIAKPRSGSRGRHTTLDIRDEAELKKGFEIARQLSSAVIIEAYLKGTIHRVTLVGGEPVAIARREYPHVIGDGTHTVAELVQMENEQPYRNGVHFKKLDLSHRAPMMLKKQNLTLESVPGKGQMVVLNDKNSRLHGTLTEDVTDTVHPENLELFRHIGKMLGDPIVGVDFMIHDMTRSWREQPDAGVIECNSMPFIDVHHRVVSGRHVNVAAHLWDVVFQR